MVLDEFSWLTYDSFCGCFEKTLPCCDFGAKMNFQIMNFRKMNFPVKFKFKLNGLDGKTFPPGKLFPTNGFWRENEFSKYEFSKNEFSRQIQIEWPGWMENYSPLKKFWRENEFSKNKSSRQIQIECPGRNTIPTGKLFPTDGYWRENEFSRQIQIQTEWLGWKTPYWKNYIQLMEFWRENHCGRRIQKV